MRMQLLPALTLAAVLLATAPAPAGPLEDADALFAQAEAEAAAGRWQEALDGYLKAYQTYPKATYVFKIASAYERLGNLPRALDAYLVFNQYEPSEEVARRVEAEVKKLEGQLRQEYGKVFVSSSPQGAFVFIDELSKQSKFQTPVVRWLKEGEHSVTFQKDGHLPREIRFTIEKGGSLSIYAGLRPLR
ncbi:MAG: PEGA domain-containing protein [Deltaproteobacteria bacterium]|nr:PEGA domain-containing protein [Deltaproteobacteria bacterium]